MEMSDFDQHELGFPGARRASLKLRRGIYILPSLMTVANMLCGFYAVMATLKGGGTDLDNAAKAIGLAIVFDSFDGFVARATGTSSEFGKQFDSLADMVSFGIAPAALAFAWGVRGIAETDLLDIKAESTMTITIQKTDQRQSSIGDLIACTVAAINPAAAGHGSPTKYFDPVPGAIP